MLKAFHSIYGLRVDVVMVISINNGISVMMMLMILTMMMVVVVVVVVVVVMIWLQYWGPHGETLPKFFCKLKKFIEMLKSSYQIQCLF